MDSRHNIITDSYVTPASVHDSMPYLDRLDRQTKRFGFAVKHVGLDAGYFTSHICKTLEEKNIYGVIGYRRPTRRKGLLPKRAFEYLPDKDCYLCPEGQEFRYSTTNREGYRLYDSLPKVCRRCPLLKDTTSRNCKKTVTRHVWREYAEAVDAHRLMEFGKRIYARRKETVERSFADAKKLHGHRYARFCGLAKVQVQSLLSATCQNMKKMALLLAPLGRSYKYLQPKCLYFLPRSLSFVRLGPIERTSQLAAV